MFRALSLLAAAALLNGCSGNILLSPLDPKSLNSPMQNSKEMTDIDKGYSGLIVYLPTDMLEVDVFTQIHVLGPDNKTMVLSGDCDSHSMKSRIYKVVSIADHRHPYLLQYKHGILETYTFNATLTADGGLQSINTQSTPDQGKTLSNVTSAVTSAASSVKSFAKIQRPTTNQPCTTTPSFLGYKDVCYSGSPECPKL